MSWSASTALVQKSKANEAIDNLTIEHDEPSQDQLAAGKDAAKLLLKGIPGPFVRISMSGHANGIGWNKKEGYSDDFINIQVVQSNSQTL